MVKLFTAQNRLELGPQLLIQGVFNIKSTFVLLALHWHGMHLSEHTLSSSILNIFRRT